MVEAGIRVLPTSVSATNDFGNFKVDNNYRQLDGVKFLFTNRNTKVLETGDLYVLKFGFDLRKTGTFSNAFKYSYSAYANSGDLIFLPNSRTIMLRVGASTLPVAASGSLTENVLLDSVFYNPSIQLSATEAKITAYAIYVTKETCEKITHKDTFPALVPNEPTAPTLTMTSLHGKSTTNQFEDYQITFKMSTSSLSDLSLVKKISIQFPSFATVPIKFNSAECIETTASVI